MPIDIRPGIYSVDYFSGSQVAIYIGDILIDEVTSISYQISQNKVPLYGYSDQYYRAVSKGQKIVQGQFTINFKEAGYLWLVLDTYQKMINGKAGKLYTPFTSGSTVEQRNIEQIINGETTTADRTKAMLTLAQAIATAPDKDFVGPPSDLDGSLTDDKTLNTLDEIVAQSNASLGGYSSISRSLGVPGAAESALEAFEDAIWKKNSNALDDMNRSPDDHDLNPFDIYIAYGDFAGDDRVNHTIRKLTGVHIVSAGQQVVIDGIPIQETYQFIARNMV